MGAGKMAGMSKSVKIVVGIIGLIGSMAFGFPKPSPVPVDWELDFKFQDLKRILMCVPGQKPQIYWYMIYTVSNNTGQDVVFHPEFTLVTNTLKVLPAMVNVEPEVFKAIKNEYKSTYPWLEHPSKVIGKILQGKDNARDSVAIWPDFDPKATSVNVFAGGLAGEIVAVPNPAFVPGKSDPKKIPPQFVLRKTLRIHYAMPSDTANRNQTTPSRAGQSAIEWVMR
jgi:hypothetical protein